MTIPTRRRWQFSLRTLFVVVTLAALPCAWLGALVRRDQRTEIALAVLRKNHPGYVSNPGYVEYQSFVIGFWPGNRTVGTIGIVSGEWTREDCRWARDLHGLETIELYDGHEVGAISDLAEIEGLHTLLLFSSGFDDASLRELANVKKLRYLHLEGTSATEEGMTALHEALPQLEMLDD